MNKEKLWGMRRDYPNIWYIWKGMLERCNNINHKSYEYYRAKGIKVCTEWHHCYLFLNWALKNNYQEGYSIDRIDTDKGYYPDNCQLIPMNQNIIKANKSRRGKKFHIYKDEQCLQVIKLLENSNFSYKEISKKTNIPISTISDINNCHTHTKLHSYNKNIRQESVTTNCDECNNVE